MGSTVGRIKEKVELLKKSYKELEYSKLKEETYIYEIRNENGDLFGLKVFREGEKKSRGEGVKNSCNKIKRKLKRKKLDNTQYKNNRKHKSVENRKRSNTC